MREVGQVTELVVRQLLDRQGLCFGQLSALAQQAVLGELEDFGRLGGGLNEGAGRRCAGRFHGVTAPIEKGFGGEFIGGVGRGAPIAPGSTT